jgi:hypothetical protein
MKVKLIRDARSTVKAGETVEVSPVEAAFLVSTRSAVPVSAAKETPAAPPRQTATKKKG